MLRYEITPSAKRDIETILEWTQEQFGVNARLRYEALLMRAMIDIAANPTRTGFCLRSDISADIRTYHLWHSRNRVAGRGARVKHPRHILMYKVRNDGVVEIGRILHESMDIDRRLS